jgi:transposase
LGQELEPRLTEAKNGKRIVYFADAVHFVHGVFVACIWCLTRIFMPTPSGRNRYNILGAIDAISHDFVSVCNTSYINSLSVCELLEKISLKHKKDSIPVTIVLDNARYQRCAYVMERAKELKIELLFLPSYSPNLNIIERLWKWTKKDCLNGKYYSKFSEFVEAINHSIMKTENKENKYDLDSLLSLNFQLYDSAIYNRV